jgi:hypothetical protein
MVASKRPVSLPDKILILILIDLSWVIIGSIFRAATLGGSIFSKLSLSPFILLLLPFIYLYVKKSISEQPVLYKKELLHFVLPLIFVLAGIVYEPLYLLEDEMHNNPKFNLVMVLNPILSVMYAAYYLSLTYRLIQIHQKRIPWTRLERPQRKKQLLASMVRQKQLRVLAYHQKRKSSFLHLQELFHMMRQRNQCAVSITVQRMLQSHLHQ